MTFSELGLSQSLLKGIDQKNLAHPFPIQEQAIPAILSDKDVLAIAPTGSGKTESFVLPVLQKLAVNKHGFITKNRYIKCLVLVPTRELAVQVWEVFHYYSSKLPTKIKSLAVYGGVSINPQMIQLQGVEILVATPGRLLDLIDSKAVFLSNVEVLVLDEADKMLNLGFKEEINQIFLLLPVLRQNLLFSATLGKDIHTITEILLRNPLKIEIKPETDFNDLIQQKGYSTTEDRKGPLLRYLINELAMQQVLVFTSSIHRADAVAEKLNKNGINAMAMHSKKSQGARTDALNSFKSGRITVLVATDLASRGIDIQFLPFVVNYELPRSPKDYIHRIGRTGRAESSGTAISLISEEEEHHFKIIQKKIGKQIEITATEHIDLKGI